MKTIPAILIAAAALTAAGCSGSGAQGEEAVAEAAAVMTVDSLLDNAAAYTDSLVTVEGVCTHTCRHGATKMFLIGTDDSKTIRVEACELGSFRPEVVNSLVKVKGRLREQRIDQLYLSDWERRLAESGGSDGHGETGAGCDSERAARGMESASAADQIAEYRNRINQNIAYGRNPWISYYYIDAEDYEVEE